MVESSISPSGKVTAIDASCDIELAWSDRLRGRFWVCGYDYNSTTSLMYSTGDNAGSYGSNYSDDRERDWTTADVYYVSYGLGCAYPMPQIYFTAQANE